MSTERGIERRKVISHINTNAQKHSLDAVLVSCLKPLHSKGLVQFPLRHKSRLAGAPVPCRAPSHLPSHAANQNYWQFFLVGPSPANIYIPLYITSRRGQFPIASSLLERPQTPEYCCPTNEHLRFDATAYEAPLAALLKTTLSNNNPSWLEQLRPRLKYHLLI